MSNLLACRLADELWMLAVSFLPIRNVIPHLPRVSKYFNDVIVWGPTSGALMWREMASGPDGALDSQGLNARVFKVWSRDRPSRTALILACVRGAPLAHVSSLIVGGANVNAVDRYGYTALHWASNRGRVDIVLKLLEANADPNNANNGGFTPLMDASASGHSAVVVTLVANGARVNHACRNGQTSLMWASRENRVDVVHTLVAARADINFRGDEGQTALDIARCRENHYIVTILESAMSEQ